MKGIVFEVKDNKAVIMRNDGGFISVKAQHDWEIGDVVIVKQPAVQMKRFVALAASIALVISLGLGGYSFYFTPVSLVSVDVNPSLEISLNRFDRVIATESHNAESREALENISINNMRYIEAMELLMQDDYLGRYISQGGYLVVTVQTAGEEKQELMLQNLQATTETAISHHGEVNTEYYAVDGEFVEAAHEHGVTAGKYMVLMELAEINPDVDILEYSHCSVEEIKGQISEHSSDGMHYENGDEDDNSEHGGRHH